jgi:hypothetical protein
MENEKTVLINNEAVPESATKTVISFKLPTPKWASVVFNYFLILTMIAALAVSTFSNEIPDVTEALINKSLLFGIGVVRILTKAFGIELKDVG